MKILINTPKLSLSGGVANHYLGLRHFWSEEVQYNIVGKRSSRKRSGIFWLPWDLIKFFYKLLFSHPDIVILNPSLDKSAILRDSIFLHITHFMGIKIVVLVHGWEQLYADKINKYKFTQVFNKASLILVLANDFKQQLISWGITVPIKLTTTKVDDNLLRGFDISIRKEKAINNILFLSRIEKEKGIYIAIDTYLKIKKENSSSTLTIVGDGSELNNIKELVSNKALDGIFIKGKLSGQELKNQFINADFYLFPTYFGEGMPTSVLEAMAFGLPLLTRPNAGLADFLNEKMGYCTESIDSNDYAIALNKMLSNRELYNSIAIYNYEYAQKHFLASKVAKQLESYCKSVLCP